MSNHNHDAIDELNDLIEIHNDRIRGYEKALENAEAANLHTISNEMKEISMRQKAALAEHITARGGTVAEGTTVSGKLFRTWMDIKSTFTDNDTESMLESSVFGEEAAQKAYDLALAEDDLTAEVRSLLTSQQAELKVAQQKIKALEEMAD